MTSIVRNTFKIFFFFFFWGGGGGRQGGDFDASYVSDMHTCFFRSMWIMYKHTGLKQAHKGIIIKALKAL